MCSLKPASEEIRACAINFLTTCEPSMWGLHTAEPVRFSGQDACESRGAYNPTVIGKSEIHRTRTDTIRLLCSTVAPESRLSRVYTDLAWSTATYVSHSTGRQRKLDYADDLYFPSARKREIESQRWEISLTICFCPAVPPVLLAAGSCETQF